MILEFIKRDINKKLPDTMKNLSRKIFMEKIRPKKQTHNKAGYGNKTTYQPRQHQQEQPSGPMTLNIVFEGKNLLTGDKTIEDKISITATLDNSKQKKELSNVINEKIGLPVTPQDYNRNRYDNNQKGGHGNYQKGPPAPQLIIEVSSNTRHFQCSIPVHEIPFKSGMSVVTEKVEEINLSKFSRDYQGVVYLKMFKADGLTRFTRTASQEAKFLKIQQDTGFADKIKTDDTSKKIQNINLLMQQITRENFDEIQTELVAYCNEVETYTTVIKSLVDKARKHQQFTELYADLCCNLTSQKYDWDQDKNNKVFKQKVVAEIREEFFNGFEEFKKWVSEIKKQNDLDENEF